jgi:two-component system response regulator HupR/HoxA
MAQMQRPLVAFVDDEKDLAESLADKFSKEYDTFAFTSASEALEGIDASFAAVIADHRMPGMTGAELLTKLREKAPDTVRILLTAVSDADLFRRLINEAKIFHFLPKEPLFPEQMKNVLADAVELFCLRQEQKRNLLRLTQETAQLKAQLRVKTGEERTFEDLLGEDPRLKEAIKRGKWAAKNDHLTVLITGESGTGKDIMARAIHYEGARRAKPFKAENCAGYHKELIRSELFGIVKGSFTGATAASDGVFREAEGGTVFLDEIGELPLDAQGHLLRFLDGGYIQPVGYTGPQNLRANVRIIAATNRDLAAEVASGRFRLDLFERLKQHLIHLPPLRERRGDIAELARHAAVVSGSRYGLDSVPISSAAMDCLQHLPYPGNVRELYNIMIRAVNCMLMSDGTTLELEYLREVVEPGVAEPIDTKSSLDAATEAFRKRYLEDVIRRNETQLAAAKQLGMSDRNLRELVKRYGIAKGA